MNCFDTNARAARTSVLAWRMSGEGGQMRYPIVLTLTACELCFLAACFYRIAIAVERNTFCSKSMPTDIRILRVVNLSCTCQICPNFSLRTQTFASSSAAHAHHAYPAQSDSPSYTGSSRRTSPCQRTVSADSPPAAPAQLEAGWRS